MANCCVYYLFYSYAAASLIYLIIGIFAATGNVAVLMEHLKPNTSNATNFIDEEERGAVKSRTLAQYFLASAIAVITSLLLYIFCLIGKSKGTPNAYQEQIKEDTNKSNINDIMQIEADEDEDNVNKTGNVTMPIEMAMDNTKIITNESEAGTEGMKENII